MQVESEVFVDLAETEVTLYPWPPSNRLPTSSRAAGEPTLDCGTPIRIGAEKEASGSHHLSGLLHEYRMFRCHFNPWCSSTSYLPLCAMVWLCSEDCRDETLEGQRKTREAETVVVDAAVGGGSVLK